MKRKCVMTTKPSSPLPRSECLCAICREIMLEPVTLPCNHTLCRPCFQMTVEKASLCCPFCRLRVSTWARHNARSGTLINKELWEIIQRQFPEECARRACGLDTEEEETEDGFTSYPAPQLCNPGEIRQEYEAEISKIEAERLRREEEERKASEEYIQKLLAEEEAEQQRSLERSQRELEEQMKKDEELAWMLSDLNDSTASSVIISPVASPATNKTVSAKSCKRIKRNGTQSGDIERFLSPQSRKVGGTERSNVRNGDLQKMSTSANGLLEESDDSMPTLSPQTPVYLANSPLDVSHSELNAPGLTVYSTRNASQSVSQSSSADKGSGHTVTNEIHLNTTTADFSPPRCSSSMDSHRKRKNFQWNETSMVEEGHEQSPTRTLDFFGDAGEHPSDKRACLQNNVTPGYHIERLMELEGTLDERKQQEEQDRLYALKLQKVLDKELRQISRQKGSPDEYKLRPKRNATQQEPTPQNRTALTHSTDQSSQESSENGESSDENKTPAPKKHSQSLSRERSTRKTSEKLLSPSTVKVLKPSNKQQTILDMFQKSVPNK